ncbi:MAG: DNA-directed RNA polymerase subunit omega [Bdellovibrionota bacterium]
MARVSVEDCQNRLPNRFELVMVAADRARQLMDGVEASVKSKNKICVTALREIANGSITKLGEAMDRSGDVIEILDRE